MTLALSTHERPETALRVWGAIGAAFRADAHNPPPDWEAVSRLMRTNRERLDVEARNLGSLFEASRNRLAPFDDPLRINLGLHRWLKSGREEAYSDWLQWVVEQIGAPDLVYRLFDLQPPDGWATWPN